MTYQTWLSMMGSSDPALDPNATTLMWGHESELDFSACETSGSPFVAIQDDFPEFELTQYRHCPHPDCECKVYEKQIRFVVRMCPKRVELKGKGKITKECKTQFEDVIYRLRQMCYCVDMLDCSFDEFRCMEAQSDTLPRTSDNETHGLIQVLSFRLEYRRCVERPVLTHRGEVDNYPELVDGAKFEDAE